MVVKIFMRFVFWHGPIQMKLLNYMKNLKKKKLKQENPLQRDYRLTDELILQAKEIVYPGGLSLQMTISGFENREDVERFANLYLGNQYDYSLPSMNETIH